MIYKKFEDITIEDFQSLIDNKVAESKSIEYKRELHLSTDKEKREFLADISAFANTSGGDLIIGIEEDKLTKLPSKVCGYEIGNLDSEILKIENIIRDGLSPRIPRIHFKPLEISSNKYLLLIRIERSYIAPHRVVLSNHDKFYKRNSKGKYPMDIDELREAFLSIYNLDEKMRMFIQNRIDVLSSNKYNIFKKGTPLYILHMIPFSAFNFNEQKSAAENKAAIIASKASTFCGEDSNEYNIDGILQQSLYFHGEENETEEYTQYYKNGIIEAVTTKFFNLNTGDETENTDDKKEIRNWMLVQYTLRIVKKYMEYLKSLGVLPPVVISLSLINVKDYCIPAEWPLRNKEIDRSALLIGDVIVNDYNINVKNLLKPLFTNLWNASGYLEFKYKD